MGHPWAGERLHQARRRCPCLFLSRSRGHFWFPVRTVGCWRAASGLGECQGPPSGVHAPSTGIVISSSAASPSEGTSSDSCLTFSAGDGPGGLSGRLAAQGLVGTCSPLRLASPLLGAQSATPVLQAQGAPGGVTLLPISFQEGRRASDTSLTQGDFPFGAHFPLSQKMLCAPGGYHFVLGQKVCPQCPARPGRVAVLPGSRCPGLLGQTHTVSRWRVRKAQETLGCPAAPTPEEAAPACLPGLPPFSQGTAHALLPQRILCPDSYLCPRRGL